MIPPKKLPPPDDRYPVRCALLSVSDKTGIVDFGKKLSAAGIKLISTGGTARALQDAGLPVTEVAEITGFPEILDGRVKTLHPKIHAGLLARRNDPEDVEELEALETTPIDLVVVNLYQFEKATAGEGVEDALAIENIDIGGPTMIRAAAKNFFFVGVVTSPNDYEEVASELSRNGNTLSMQVRRELAQKAFAHTAAYDAAITDYFSRRKNGASEDSLPRRLSLSFPLGQSLRYGENPHQRAGYFGDPSRFFDQIHGKELSFNNILDLSAALRLIDEFDSTEPTAAILKHTNPCGVASAATLSAAYRKAFATDRQSPFGGVVVVNCPLDLETAQAIDEIFTEIIIAPAFADGVLDLLAQKKNRRLIRAMASASQDESLDLRSVIGGMLAQDQDRAVPVDALRQTCTVVTKRAPSGSEWADLVFAWRVVKHVKSNAIVYARDQSTLGIGAGQMSRIDASEIAVQKGLKSGLNFEGSAVASDAFFPFADGLLAAARTGARAVIQPGGSVRDEEVISAANDHDVAMVFTGQRHFRH